MYLISVYVPESHSEIVKSALFEAGAGRYGNYDCCAWQTTGTGQFRPLEGSNPFAGRKNVIEKIPEVKIEVICPPELIDEAIQAVKNAHPYEEPALHYFKISL